MPKAKKKYIDVSVSAQLLQDLHSKMDGETGMYKYGRYKTWLRYANLDSWQKQKWHWGYANYEGKELHCTCGLVIAMGAAHEVGGLSKLELDAAHRAKGHRKLPEFGEVVVAFIYDYKWMEDLGVYNYDALCQVCGDYVLTHPEKEADMFTEIHNISCG